jgi:hypothetical protein
LKSPDKALQERGRETGEDALTKREWEPWGYSGTLKTFPNLGHHVL